ncbi:hypothetical protein [Novipirellula sp.]|uniref:hypothetical protein n=1 Tax=Novipirellula sp. TaxID=2795430 RepID=UPI00356B4A5C
MRSDSAQPNAATLITLNSVMKTNCVGCDSAKHRPVAAAFTNRVPITPVGQAWQGLSFIPQETISESVTPPRFGSGNL